MCLMCFVVIALLTLVLYNNAHHIISLYYPSISTYFFQFPKLFLYLSILQLIPNFLPQHFIIKSAHQPFTSTLSHQHPSSNIYLRILPSQNQSSLSKFAYQLSKNNFLPQHFLLTPTKQSFTSTFPHQFPHIKHVPQYFPICLSV